MSEGPQVIGPYRVVEALAQGGQGDTYIVETPDGQIAALKRLRLDAVFDDRALARFHREARVLASLSHPCIPRFIDSGVCDEGLPFLVEERVVGDTLTEAVAQGRRFEQAQAAELARQLLRAVEYLHALHPPVVHRDIKPDNIILGPTGPVLIDFGAVCSQVVLEGDAASTIVGTFGYMAPEVLKGRVGPQSDLYSLGATLLFALSGREPEDFPSERLAIRFRDSLSLDPNLADLLEALLQPASEDRPAGATEAIEILAGRGALVASPIPTSPIPPTPPGSLERRLKRAAIIVGALGALTLGLQLAGLLETVAMGIAIILVIFLVIISFTGF